MYACIGDVFLSRRVRCTKTEFSTRPVVVYLGLVLKKKFNSPCFLSDITWFTIIVELFCAYIHDSVEFLGRHSLVKSKISPIPISRYVRACDAFQSRAFRCPDRVTFVVTVYKLSGGIKRKKAIPRLCNSRPNILHHRCGTYYLVHSKPTHSFKIWYIFNFHNSLLVDLQQCLHSIK
ncbi:hypothetical protein QTP88_005147 [Uroleucon formosanum]